MCRCLGPIGASIRSLFRRLLLVAGGGDWAVVSRETWSRVCRLFVSVFVLPSIRRARIGVTSTRGQKNTTHVGNAPKRVFVVASDLFFKFAHHNLRCTFVGWIKKFRARNCDSHACYNGVGSGSPWGSDGLWQHREWPAAP
ncbi:hypothetical protein AAG570_010621 [Ranatra chinensis]|uniref:Secreted protein n=1 Tax=Ranatra chinensis TaxID=642074 RepID=A0ABD0YN33_9HEMI